MRSKKVITTVLLSLLIIVVVVGTLTLSALFSTPVEAQSPQRLKLQDIRKDDNSSWHIEILTFCDEATGNLLYALISSQKAGLSVVTSGCQKNLR